MARQATRGWSGYGTAATDEFKSARLDVRVLAAGRLPGLIVASTEHFQYRRDRWLNPKYLVWLCDDEVSFGLFIEQSYSAPDSARNWRRLLDLIESGTEAHEVITSAAESHGLVLALGHSGERWTVSDGDVVGPSKGTRLSWTQFLDHLRSVPEDIWTCLHVARCLAASEAIGLGGSIAHTIGDVFQELEPAYLVVAGDAE